MKSLNRRRILVLIDTATGWGRNIIRGIARFARESGQWDLSLQPRGQIREIPVPSNWKGDGIIARIASPELLKQIIDTRLPTVNISSLRIPRCPFPRVVSNFEAVGQLVADHFLEKGFQNFAICATESTRSFSEEVYRSFRSHLADSGYAVSEFILDDNDFHSEKAQQKLAAWLKKTKKEPLAVFALSVEAPHALIESCGRLGFHIPEDVAIISNASVDELVLQVTNPAISCISTAETTIGYEAARRLEVMMREGRSTAPDEVHQIEPSHIEVRTSSDILQIQDDSLRKALAFIERNAHRGVQVQDIAEHAGLSRRSLELRMKKMIRRTPAEEIRQVRLRRACQLLASTHLSIPDVAERSGFGTVEHFIVFFKRETGQTPLQYSKNYHRIADS